MGCTVFVEPDVIQRVSGRLDKEGGILICRAGQKRTERAYQRKRMHRMKTAGFRTW
jgi:hypothetical protein